ncbi:uncharacterized protein LOC126734355 [Anthonomus grandis grandis]|uniref:uncharacterized protein LOC126734355 n=1 Tax=Anthonomus grandis grandis TaxID=2921223 RepID=UPI002165C5A9|nr:uncharacterized protein LOC126734355 [Anthonomus grandis grandis]
MIDVQKENPQLSGNVSNEEELVKSTKMDHLSEEKISSKKEELVIETIVKESVSGTKDEVKIENVEQDKKLKEQEIVKPVKDNIKEATLSDVKAEIETNVRKESESAPCCTKQPVREKIIRNQSDIFSLKHMATTLQTSIFSVNGSPSRKLFRKQEPACHLFQKNEGQADKTEDSAPLIKSRITRENYNDEKRPSSSYRNPLTGTGLSSNDEYKSKGLKRKDGNPLLGLGYDEVNHAVSQHRIPPGGYSHKLW